MYNEYFFTSFIIDSIIVLMPLIIYLFDYNSRDNARLFFTIGVSYLTSIYIIINSQFLSFNWIIFLLTIIGMTMFCVPILRTKLENIMVTIGKIAKTIKFYMYVILFYIFTSVFIAVAFMCCFRPITEVLQIIFKGDGGDFSYFIFYLLSLFVFHVFAKTFLRFIFKKINVNGQFVKKVNDFIDSRITSYISKNIENRLIGCGIIWVYIANELNGIPSLHISDSLFTQVLAIYFVIYSLFYENVKSQEGEKGK